MKHLHQCLFLSVILCSTSCMSENDNSGKMRAGGWSDASIEDEWVADAAKFAVTAKQEEMRKAEESKDATLALVKIISAKRQVVAGMNYQLKIEIKLDGTVKTADVRVWRKLSGDFEMSSWEWK